MRFSAFCCSSKSNASLLRSPLSHTAGRDPTQIMIATTIMESFMLFGGSASGPARNESITTQKTSIAAVEMAHNRAEETDSGTG